MIIRQLKIGFMDNFTNIVGCDKTKKAMVIDPGADVDRILAEAKNMKLADDTVVWPGHDYGPTPRSALHWEKRNNVNAVEYGYYSGD